MGARGDHEREIASSERAAADREHERAEEHDRNEPLHRAIERRHRDAAELHDGAAELFDAHDDPAVSEPDAAAVAARVIGEMSVKARPPLDPNVLHPARRDQRSVVGARVVLFSEDADADRSFLADMFGFVSTTANGGGWLIFGLPPADVAVHPAGSSGCELNLVCRDLGAEMERLRAAGVECSDVEETRSGSVTTIRLPSGGQLALCQPSPVTSVEAR